MRRNLPRHALPFQTKWSKKRSAYRPSWLSPGLTSHQLLDAGIAARQSASRKNLQKAQHPFANYFRATFRCSDGWGSVVGRRGVVSAYAAVRLATDPTAQWAAPWGRESSRGLFRTRRKRQDALERTTPVFGEDEGDQGLTRLLALRFAWDREDELLVTHLVPHDMFCLCEHSLLYAAVGHDARDQTHATGSTDYSGDGDEEILMIDGVPVTLRNPTASGKQLSSKHRDQTDNSREVAKNAKWGFTGVNAIPSIVMDIVRGPFLSSPHDAELTLRWKAANRRAKSVSEVLKLQQQISAASAVGLPPRSALLLLFSIATAEIEAPALEVSLGIAMGENYYGYHRTECLEMLRCLRRLAFVRGLPTVTSFASSQDSLSCSRGAFHRAPSQYEDAFLTEGLLGKFIADTAPFLAAKVWARLPEHSERLLRRHLYLDWIDLLYLAVEVNGNRLPRKLPNPCSSALYASKYLFLHYTLQIDEPTMESLVARMRGRPPHVYPCLQSSKAKGLDNHSESGRRSYPNAAVESTPPPGASATSSGDNSEETQFTELVEDHEKSLILWLSASFLVRLVSEALGDVLNHVGTYLQQHAQLLANETLGKAVGTDSPRTLPTSDSLSDGGSSGPNTLVGTHPCGIDGSSIISDHLGAYLDRLMLYRPRVAGKAAHLLSRRRPKKVRVRLLPYESFPELARSLPSPIREVMQQVGLMERSQRVPHQPSLSPQSQPQPQPSIGHALRISNRKGNAQKTTLTLASLIAQSSLASSHIERAAAALRWSTMVLHHCLGVVQGLPPLDFSMPASVSVAEQRQVHCKRFARSKIQLFMDELFFYIPWEEMESNIEPLLAHQREGIAAVSSDVPEPSFLTAFANEHIKPDCDDDSHEGSSEKTDEEKGRALLRDLQLCVDEFQLSVADLLEAYEKFFGQEKGFAGVASDDNKTNSEGEGQELLDTCTYSESQVS